MRTTTNPRIYVACLASYNNGILHGKWIDATQEVEAVKEEIKEMLADSSVPDAEEYAIHDTDGFESITVDEYDSIETVCGYAKLLNHTNPKLIAALKEHLSAVDPDYVLTYFEENYRGMFDNVGAYAYDFMKETGDLKSIPDCYANYIDFDKMAQDWELSGDIFTIEFGYKECHVFTNE